MESLSKPTLEVAQRQELRDPRFAELEEEIRAEAAARMAPKAPSTRKRKGRKSAVPTIIRKEIALFARELKRRHKALFIADPKLKDRVARMLRSMLPPKRRRGRPALDSVTIATRLLLKFRRECPNDSHEQRWARIYPIAINEYADMLADQQRMERNRLRERVRSRRNKRRGRQPRGLYFEYVRLFH